MRSYKRRALTLGIVAITALAWSGCDAKKQTEYVAGVSTQVQVPRDLKAIRVDVSVGGVIQFCRGYRVYDGKVQLPRSLGEFPASGKPGPDPITVTVSGFTEEFSETTGKDVFDNCSSVAPKVGNEAQGTRILRRSRQPYVADSVLFLPMALRYSCYDKDCANETDTCKGGRCVDAKIDESKLPRYSDDLVDGTGGNCFPASKCMAVSVPAMVVDPNDCTYALPNTPSAPPLAPGAPAQLKNLTSPGDGINVQVTYDGGLNTEILDKDPEEGFTIPDPAKPQRFRLSPGLCDLVKGIDDKGVETKHRITAVRAAGLCQAKTPFQPLCAGDQLAAMGTTPDGVSGNVGPAACKATELTSSKSVLMLLVDNSKHNSIFFTGGGGGAGSGELAQSDLLSAALLDPAFKHTFIGLTYFPGETGAACTGHVPAVEPLVTKDARPQIVSSFKALGVANSPGIKDTDVLNLRGALEDAYAKLTVASDAKTFRRAVFIIGNSGFDVNSCGGTPAARALQARTGPEKIETYVALLARDSAVPDTNPPPPIPGAQALADAGRTPAPDNVFDARKDKDEATRALRAIVDDLATCAYDLDTDPGDGAILSFSDPTAFPPLQNPLYTIAHDSACTPDNTAGNGWSYNAATKRVHVCGAACKSYRDVLKSAAGFGAAVNQPSLAVPLFAHKAGCAPK